MLYTGISHTGRSTKQSLTHVLSKHLAVDETRKWNTVLYYLGNIAQGRLSHSLYNDRVFPDWALEPSLSVLVPRDRLPSNLSSFSARFGHEDVCRTVPKTSGAHRTVTWCKNTHTHAKQDKHSLKNESPWKVEISCSRFILVEQIQNWNSYGWLPQGAASAYRLSQLR